MKLTEAIKNNMRDKVGPAFFDECLSECMAEVGVYDVPMELLVFTMVRKILTRVEVLEKEKKDVGHQV